MTVSGRSIALILLLLYPALLVAQLSVTSPVPRIVYQRNKAEEATIIVTGLASSAATRIEARFVPMAIGQGQVTRWTTLPPLPSSSAFRGSVVVQTGQYRLDVRAFTGNTLLAETHVNRVGVGEVFVLAGQSNVYGGFRRVPSSEEDRVSCVDFRQETIDEYLLPFQFSNVSYGSNIGPSQPPHLWSVLGDRLVRYLNVPVMFLGAALGGTSSSEWKQSAAGTLGNTLNSAVYRRLGVALLHYVSRTGARAILWHQGESDDTTNTQTYFDNIHYVIDKTRQQTGFNQLAWMVSRASYINGKTNPDVITAQNRLINEVHDVFAGPATDSLTGPANRPDNVHLLGDGMYRFVNTWMQCLSTSFFQNCIPYTPTDESSLITSGYTLPLTRRPGETIQAASLRSDAHDLDNEYVAQIVRADNNQVVSESAPGTTNPLTVTLPADVPDGSYRIRTRSTHPVTVGTVGEAFQVSRSAAPTAPQSAIPLATRGGTSDPAIQRLAYRYEIFSHGFFVMLRAEIPVEVRLERIDGGNFSDSGWYLVPPGDQAPDYTEFADFNYIRNYPPAAAGVGGVEPGRYRLSVRRQGSSGNGFWYDVNFIDGKHILHYAMEAIPPVPPVLTTEDIPTTQPCLSGSFPVYVTVTDGSVNSGNTFTVQLSDSTGSFHAVTNIGIGNTSPVQATLPAGLPAGNKYRIRVVASNPTVASAPSLPLPVCSAMADLSLAMQVDNRTPSVGQIISLTVSLTNAGPNDATGVQAQSRLPSFIDFVDSPNPAVSSANNTVRVATGTILAGSTVPYTFRVKATQPGTFVTAAQISSSSATDPDSQPDSGTGDGQDDAAYVDLRTANANGPLITSPNPNQTPLPTVLSNQPLADPNKADLSLDLQASRLVVNANESINLTVTVNNQGGLAASDVAVQVLLPNGWQLTDSNGFLVNGQTVTAVVGSVAVNSYATVSLLVRIGSSGMVSAQVSGVSQPDPDSTPGNGYTNGEDDEASIRIRLK